MLKSLTKNSLYNFIGQILPAGIGLLSIPIIIEYGGLSNFSSITIYLTIITIGVIADFGIGKAIIKLINNSKFLNEKKKVFSSGLVLAFIFSIFSILIIFCIKFLIKESINSEYLILVNYSIALIPILIFLNFFRSLIESENKFFEINLIRIFFNSVIYILIAFLFYINYETVQILMYINLLKLLQLIITIIFINKTFINYNFSKVFFFKTLSLSLDLGIINFLGTIIGYVDRFMLPVFISFQIAGYYYVGNEFATKFWIIAGAIFSAAFPKMMKNPKFFAKPKVIYKINFILMIIFIPFIMFFILFSEEFFRLISGESFDNLIVLCFKIIFIAVIINCLNQINYNILIANNREKSLRNIQLINFLIYIFIFFFMTKYFGIVGASIAFLFRLIIDAVLIEKISRKYSKYIFKKEFLFVLATLVFFAIPELFANDYSLVSVLLLLTLHCIILKPWKWKKILY